MDKSAVQVALRMIAPPRPVPLSCRLVLALNAVVQVGCFVLAFSTPFFWLFAGSADIPAVTFRGDSMRTNGAVTRIEDTNASENDGQIRGVHYRYSVNAHAYEGVSYETGDSEREPGDLVIVEYLARDPSISRIEGMRRGMFSAAVLFVLIFPLAGLVVTAVGLAWGMRRSRVLVRGVAVFARYKETRSTNTRVNNRPVYEVIHEYRTLDGELHESSTRTTDVDALTDDHEELLLYDPSRPSRGVPVDSIKPLPGLDEGGGFRGNPAGALLRLILPALLIGVNGWIWLARAG